MRYLVLTLCLILSSVYALAAGTDLDFIRQSQFKNWISFTKIFISSFTFFIPLVILFYLLVDILNRGEQKILALYQTIHLFSNKISISFAILNTILICIPMFFMSMFYTGIILQSFIITSTLTLVGAILIFALFLGRLCHQAYSLHQIRLLDFRWRLLNRWMPFAIGFCLFVYLIYFSNQTPIVSGLMSFLLFGLYFFLPTGYVCYGSYLLWHTYQKHPQQKKLRFYFELNIFIGLIYGSLTTALMLINLD